MGPGKTGDDVGLLTKSLLIFGSLVELVTMPPCHGGGHGFESHTNRETCFYGKSQHNP